MTWLWALVALLVVFGSVLAVSESSLTRITHPRALALLQTETVGRRRAHLLEKIAAHPAHYLNSVYLTVMITQNGSAILVAILAERAFAGHSQGLWVGVISAAFTLAYFVFVEAMSKTFGVTHTDRAALLVAPVVYALGRSLALPTRALIGLANVLLPGKGLKQGPFVEEEIRSMAAAGQEEGEIEDHEAELIHSVFDFGDRLVRDVMVPRPDMVAAPLADGLRPVLDLLLRHGFSRLPLYRDRIDDIAGVVYAKDLLRHLHAGNPGVPLEAVMRDPLFVPETLRASHLLRRMQSRKVHMAIVTDEYGSTAGLVTIEDLLEELVGEIADEHDPHPTAEAAAVDERTWVVSGRMTVSDLNQLLAADLPREDWNTVAGLVYGLYGAVPTLGVVVRHEDLTFTVEGVQGRRISKVRVTRDPSPPEVPADE